MISVAQAHAQLTAPGAPFEMEEAVIRGLRYRVWKSTPKNLRVVFDEMRAHGNKDYVVYEDDRLTFADAIRASSTLAHLLRDRYGVKKGDRVAIAMRNFPEWVVAFWGITTLGAVVVPLNAWWSAEELQYGLEDSGSRVVFADEERAVRLVERDAAARSRCVHRRARQRRRAGRLRRLRGAVGVDRGLSHAAARRAACGRTRSGRRRDVVLHLRHDRSAERCARHASQHLHQPRVARLRRRARIAASGTATSDTGPERPSARQFAVGAVLSRHRLPFDAAARVARRQQAGADVSLGRR